MHDRTVERYGLDADVVKQQANDGLVRRYVVDNDILTHLQEDALPLNAAAPDAPGARINLQDPNPLTTFEKLMPWNTWPHRVENHYIEAVIKSMDKAGYTLSAAAASRANAQADTPTDALNTASRLLGDSVRGLAPQRKSLGLRDDMRFYTTAANLAATAGRDGLRGNDHVVPGGRSVSTLFAVEGDLEHASHRRSSVDVAQASAVSTEASTAQLREDAAPVAIEPTQVEQQRRMISA